MHKLTFTLKQHTPLIHFQHDQTGATLRATEVKPRLDFFIMKKLLNDTGIPDHKVREVFLERANNPHDENQKKWKNWLVGNGDHAALDYKLKVLPYDQIDCELNILGPKQRQLESGEKINVYETESFPMLLSNMGGKESTNELKNLSFFQRVKLIFTVYDIDLKSQIANSICDFLFQTNFGNRQSKGFGCFYPDENEHSKETWYKNSTSPYHFDLFPENNENIEFSALFKKIELFYRTLRGGINEKKKLYNTYEVDRAKKEQKYHRGADGNDYLDVFYFKSLMFLYAREVYKANWEKRKIKENFFPKSTITFRDGTERTFPYRLDKQEEARPLSDQLIFNTRNFFLFRDILGLATDESWKSYKSEIHKSQAQLNRFNKWEDVPDKIKTFDRFKSPILFKPFLMSSDEGERYLRVFVLLNQSALDEALKANKDFRISNKKNNRDELHITFPNYFDLNQYFEFILNPVKFDISTHVEQKFQKTIQFQTIEDIYNQLRNNYPNT